MGQIRNTDEIGELIRSGQRLKARECLQTLQPSRIPRKEALEYASLARRADLADMALRILHPYVRPSQRKPTEATHAEKAEYAASLAYLGMTSEALHLLESVDGESYPQALLYRVFAHVSRWEYPQTIPLLEAYLSSPSLSDYQRLVGKVNLAAALNFERLPRLIPLLKEIVEEAERGGHLLLKGNVQEIAAQDALYRKEWKRAEELMRESEELLQGTGGLDAFFTRKWKAVLGFWKDPESERASAFFQATKEEAKKLKHWESWRDLDRMEGLITQNTHLITQLYYGTPFEAFRKKLLKEAGQPSIPRNFEWSRHSSDSVWLEILTGTTSHGKTGLKVGQVPHRILTTLASDFYRPFSIQVLFSRVFEGDFYHPTTSSSRIHQGVVLLRKWLSDSKLPLSVIHEAGSFSLAWEGPCNIRLTRVTDPLDSSTLLLEQLRRRRGEFTLTEGCELLQLSRSSLQRILRTATAEGKITKTGKGKATRYHFT